MSPPTTIATALAAVVTALAVATTLAVATAPLALTTAVAVATTPLALADATSLALAAVALRAAAVPFSRVPQGLGERQHDLDASFVAPRL